MKVMLDTNICIDLIKQQTPAILEHVLSHPVGDMGVFSITAAGLAWCRRAILKRVWFSVPLR